MQNGYIDKLFLDKDFGFIRADTGEQIFFHHTALADGLDFDAALEQRRVLFHEVFSRKGRKASLVQPAD